MSDAINAIKVSSSVSGRVLKSAFSEIADQVFKPNPLPKDANEQYNMTSFAIRLNEMKNGHKVNLPRTDSRFRPDIRFLENGEIKFASSEKIRYTYLLT